MSIQNFQLSALKEKARQSIRKPLLNDHCLSRMGRTISYSTGKILL